MDPTLLEQLQNEESLADDAEAAENARIEARILDLHTSIPGHVVSYDATKQTAVCQPGIQRIFRGQGAIDLPQLVDCPVHFPSGGGFVCPSRCPSGTNVYSSSASEPLTTGGKMAAFSSPPNTVRTT